MSKLSSLTDDCQATTTRSRQYSKTDQAFIAEEIRRLLQADIIESCRCPWRVQVLVVDHGLKKRTVIDYSSSAYRFTHLDAYTLSRMEELVKRVSQDNITVQLI